MKTGKQSGFLLFALAVGTFMSALDTSAVTVAIASIQKDLSASLASVEWIVTAYLLVISSLLLTFGRLADIRGHKKVYVSGFATFTLCSLLCGLAPNIAVLIAARTLQALGAAMMFSSSSAIVTANIPAERRGKAFGVIAIAVACACCVGPVIGGLLVASLGWRSVFFVNVPIGVVGTFLALAKIPRDERHEAQPFDGPGAVLVFVALFLILLPLDLSASNGFPLPVFAASMILGLVLFAAFIVRERRTAYPMLDLSLFNNKVFSASLAACTCNFAAQFMMAFIAPYYFQSIRVMSPALTGLLYMPMPLATMLVAPASGSFSDRHDSRMVSSVGMALMAIALFLLAFLDTATPYWYVIVAMTLAGIGSGMFQSPNNSAVMGCAPAGKRGMASGTLATTRNVGMVLGVALSGAIFNASSSHATVTLAASGIAGDALKTGGATAGLRATFLVASVTALLAMCASLVKGSTRAAAKKPTIETRREEAEHAL